MKNSFAQALNQWRKLRRYSQLQLSVEVEISSKHISFIETGRSRASRQMIIRLGTFLMIHKSEINNALLAAGFAPVFSEYDTPQEKLKPVFDAIDKMIQNHMPYPAIVLNQNWDIINANDTAKLVLTEVGFASSTNFIQALINDDPKTSKILNWNITVAHLLLRLRNEIYMLGGSSELEKLAKQLSLKISPQDEAQALDNQQPVLTSEMMLGGERYCFFSIIANLGAVQDVAVSEYKIELMFPNDEKTTNYFENLEVNS